MMTEAEAQEALRDILDDPDNDLTECIRSVTSYQDAGLLTMNKGLVLRMADGSEFQLQIVRSR